MDAGRLLLWMFATFGVTLAITITVIAISINVASNDRYESCLRDKAFGAYIVEATKESDSRVDDLVRRIPGFTQDDARRAHKRNKATIRFFSNIYCDKPGLLR